MALSFWCPASSKNQLVPDYGITGWVRVPRRTIFARAPSAKAVLVSTCTAAEQNSAHAQSFAGPELQITVVAKESDHFLVCYFSHVIGVWSVSESFRSRTLGSVSKEIFLIFDKCITKVRARWYLTVTYWCKQSGNGLRAWILCCSLPESFVLWWEARCSTAFAPST